MSNPIVTIEMENGDIMKAELYPEIAPNTVNNFISLIQKGYYDGLIFHRVINGFMIQGGCPDGTGMGGPGYDIKGEFSQNGFKKGHGVLLHISSKNCAPAFRRGAAALQMTVYSRFRCFCKK